MQTDRNESIQYFLGLGGKAEGPFSETEIFEKIDSDLVLEDTLLWHKGLSDWIKISTIDGFQKAFENKKEEQTVTVTTAQFSSPPSMSTEKEKQAFLGSFAAGLEEVEPIFSVNKQQKNLDTKKEWIKKISLVGGILCFSLLFSLPEVRSLVFSWVGIEEGAEENLEVEYSSQKKTTSPKKNVTKQEKISNLGERKTRFEFAKSQIMLRPEEGLKGLEKLIGEDPTDNFGKQALQEAIDYLKPRKKYQEVGKLLSLAKKQEEAVVYFLKDPPNYVAAEEALFRAFEEKSKMGEEKQKLYEILVRDIALLLKEETKKELAVERIQLLVKTFPEKQNPYSYYLKAKEEKIVYLFEKISFLFKNDLQKFFLSEFPQMKLEEGLTVKIKKEEGQRYRIIGTYEGNLKLRRDLLYDKKFVFWFYPEEWALVETNLTEERQVFSLRKKKEFQIKTLSAEETIQLLELKFKRNFPKGSFHNSALTNSDTVKRESEFE